MRAIEIDLSNAKEVQQDTTAKRWLIDKCVDSLVLASVHRFYPSVVIQLTGLDMETVFRRLVFLAEDRKLKLYFEVRCSVCGQPVFNNEANFFDIIFEDEKRNPRYTIKFEGRLLEEMVCEHCNKTIKIDLRDVFPVFEVSPVYKKYVETVSNKSFSLIIPRA